MFPRIYSLRAIMVLCNGVFADFLDLLSRGRMFVHMAGRMRFAFVV